MEENLDRMLEKLDLVLKLARGCNSTLKRIESRGKSRHISSVPSDIDEAKPEPEPKITDETEPDPEVIDELNLEL